MLVLTSAHFLTFPLFFPFTFVGAFKLVVAFALVTTFSLCFSLESDATSLLSDSLADLLEENIVAAPLDVDGVVATLLDVDGVEVVTTLPLVLGVVALLDVDCVAVALLEAPIDVDGVAAVDDVAVPLNVDIVAACPSSTKLMSSGETCPLTPSDQVGCLEKWIEHPPQMKLKLSVSKKEDDCEHLIHWTTHRIGVISTKVTASSPSSSTVHMT